MLQRNNFIPDVLYVHSHNQWAALLLVISYNFLESL